MDITSDIMNQVTAGDSLSRISTAAGGDGNAVRSALSMGIPAILGSMAATASKPGGTDSLTAMLAKAGGSSPLDNLGSYLADPAAAGGSSVAGTLLGSHMGTIQAAIAQKTGLPPETVGKVLEIAAPLVIGAVSKLFAQQKPDAPGLAGLLADQSAKALAGSPDAAAMVQQLPGGHAGTEKIAGFVSKIVLK